LGDIVKVTPTSKAVGDLALFLIANDLSCDDVLTGDRELAFPQSVVDLLDGSMGQPMGGFPENVRRRILGDRQPLADRPGALLPPADFDKTAKQVAKALDRAPTRQEIVSHLLYPKVFSDFAAHQRKYSDTAVLPTPAFFYGMQSGEEVAIDIAPGKTLIIKFLVMGEPHPDGRRTVFFELNGQPRNVTVDDDSLEQAHISHAKADLTDPRHVAAPMPGMVASLAVVEGAKVAKGQKLLMLEAMKMQTTLVAEQDGKVEKILVASGAQVETGDLLMTLEI
ncbi:MAG: biotin/lipoyl-binding protein, partial [Planctomycetales bacterium]|nr:biotin/lipoyl-binding protein [Planctomycetales bacterium]